MNDESGDKFDGKDQKSTEDEKDAGEVNCEDDVDFIVTTGMNLVIRVILTLLTVRTG